MALVQAETCSTYVKVTVWIEVNLCCVRLSVVCAISRGSGWAPESVWTFWGSQKFASEVDFRQSRSGPLARLNTEMNSQTQYLRNSYWLPRGEPQPAATSSVCDAPLAEKQIAKPVGERPKGLSRLIHDPPQWCSYRHTGGPDILIAHLWNTNYVDWTLMAVGANTVEGGSCNNGRRRGLLDDRSVDGRILKWAWILQYLVLRSL
jgi:hypothetical protein